MIGGLLVRPDFPFFPPVMCLFIRARLCPFQDMLWKRSLVVKQRDMTLLAESYIRRVRGYLCLLLLLAQELSSEPGNGFLLLVL